VLSQEEIVTLIDAALNVTTGDTRQCVFGQFGWGANLC
jgi:hypothetical protein